MSMKVYVVFSLKTKTNLFTKYEYESKMKKYFSRNKLKIQPRT